MKRFLPFLGPGAALLAEFLPWGVKMEFMNPEGPAFTESVSYFDLLPFGYGNIFPMLVVLLTCALLLDLAVCTCRPGRTAVIVGLVLSSLIAAVSVLQLIFFPVTVIGILIPLFLTGEIILLSYLLAQKTAD